MTLTVQELIEQLSKCPGNLPVEVATRLTVCSLPVVSVTEFDNCIVIYGD